MVMPRPQIPPELLNPTMMPAPAATPGAPIGTQGPGGAPPVAWDGPSEDPILREAQLATGQGIPQGSSSVPTGPLESPFGDLPGANGMPPQQGGQDLILSRLLAESQQNPPPIRKKARRFKLRKPDPSHIQVTANRDQDRHRLLIERMSRDLSLYRQHTGGLPKSFEPTTDQQVRSAQLSTLVNKLANMFSGMDLMYELPYDVMDEEKASQRIEDALYQLRKLAARTHARSSAGELLQRTEFFYMLLHGRLIKRILPDADDEQFPWQDSVIDPATCYPTFGDGKRGLIRMVRKYNSTIGEVVSLYSRSDPKVEQKLLDKIGGYTASLAVGEWWNIDGEVVEYWDDQWHYVSFKGVDIVPVMEHGLPRIPFVYVTPVGEPTGLSTPGGHYLTYSDLYSAYIPEVVGSDADIAEKGVSVFHYLVNTHRLKEMLETILFSEVEKATDPATIEYSMPHLMNQEYPALQTKRGKSNKRQQGMQSIEAVPTSPKPTDFSPLFSTLGQEFMEGSLSPAVFGAEQGSNITGSGMNALLQAAKDMALPYIKAWEMAMALEAEIRLEQFVDLIAPVMTLSAPSMDTYGHATGEIHEVTQRDVQKVGTMVTAKASGLGDQDKAAKIAYVNQAVQAGVWSQRYGMNELDVKNPDQMFSEIISEKAMQHPEIMENHLIPMAFLSQGMEDEAEMWLEFVVAPKLMQMQGGGAPGAGGMMGQEGGGGGSQAVPVPPGSPVDQAPGGPPPGEGRGPEQPPPGMM